MTTTRQGEAPTIAEFFDGVAEMRAHLDRDKMQRGRDMLTRMALDLTKSRSAEALGAWLCEGLTAALDARGVSILLRSGEAYVTHASHGSVEHQPTAVADIFGAAELAAAQHAPVMKREGFLVALVGADRPFGALWVDHDGPLDDALTPLLFAVIDAGAMTLEVLLQRPRFALEMAR